MMRIFTHFYKSQYVSRYATFDGHRYVLPNASRRNTTGIQGACKAYYLAAEVLRGRVRTVAEAVLPTPEGELQGTAMEMETTESGTNTVVFIAEHRGKTLVLHSDELRQDGTRKNDSYEEGYVPGCLHFGRMASRDEYLLCYHGAAAFLARILALHLDDEVEQNLRLWWLHLDNGQYLYEQDKQLEIACDGLYFYLKAIGEENIDGRHLTEDDLAALRVTRDLTPVVLGSPGDGRLLRLPVAPPASTPAPQLQANSPIQWPDPPELTDEERALVPSGIVYYPFGDELEEIAHHIRLTREAGLPTNILLLGDAAVGKTTLARYVAQQLRLPLVYVNCAETVDETALIGGNFKINGEWRWVDGDLIRAARRGWVVTLEEVRVLPPGVATYIHNLLDDSRRVTLHECGDPGLRQVVAHPNFVVFGTANDGDAYLTAKEMDPAFRSRWHIIRVKQLPAETRARILKERTGLPPGLAEDLVRGQDQINRQYKDGQVSYACDLRTLLYWGLHSRVRGADRPAVWRAAVHAVCDKLAANAEERQVILDALRNVLGEPPEDVSKAVLEGEGL